MTSMIFPVSSPAFRSLFYLLLIFLSVSCNREDTLFQKISSSRSGIHFNNRIIENDSINQLDVENIYNGGGVGIRDFNNDGLPDVFFTGNLVSCKLYLNQGKFRFRDITDEASVDGAGRWCRGVVVVDINCDGWQDIYVCATLRKEPEARINMLYINQGLNKSVAYAKILESHANPWYHESADVRRGEDILFIDRARECGVEILPIPGLSVSHWPEWREPLRHKEVGK